jgi:hypothetical protein
MTKLEILAATVAVVICASPLAVRADDVPTYDVNKSCKADVQAYQGTGTRAGCMTDEQNARQMLVSQWTTFAPENRTRCTQMVGDPAGPQSYVELLTCLQMAKDVKSLPK